MFCWSILANVSNLCLLFIFSTKGLECGGSERATCDCGQCRCHPGWTGERCECSLSSATCVAPSNKIDDRPAICSNRGSCECGKCQCKDSFFGAFCERSSGSNTLCSFYEPCIACLVRLKLGQECDEQAKLCSAQGVPFGVEYVSGLAVPSALCIIRLPNADNVICEHQFDYVVDTTSTEVTQRSSLRLKLQTCEQPLSAGVVGLGIVVATFLFGFLVLMVFKGVTTMKDRREFALFESQLQNTKYEEFTSPLYRSPKRSYEVPRQVRQSDGGGGINDFEMNDI